MKAGCIQNKNLTGKKEPIMELKRYFEGARAQGLLQLLTVTER
jgi:hypothetical protein